MRVLRIQVARELFDIWGIEFQQMFEDVKYVEVLEIYRYDEESIFSKVRVIFNSDFNIPDSELPALVEKKYMANYYYILERNRNELVVIMNQKRQGRMNIFKEYVWAIIPPVVINRDFVTLSILLSQADMETLIKRMTENIEVKVLANTKIEDFKSGFGYSGFSMPQITKRQMEIITYAIKRGYYDSPKKVSGQEIAKELGIEYATFYEHIRKIENKVIKHVFG